MAATSISVTVSHAISFLTRPLSPTYPATTIVKLQLMLEANLIALYAPTWDASDPLRGSGRRCLTLSPDCLPPRVIYAACLSSGVQWFDWISLLGGVELDFFVDPGCVSVRMGKKGTSASRLITVWADEVPSPTMPTLRSKPTLSLDQAAAQLSLTHQADARQSRTFSQQLLQHDAEDDQIFAMIRDEVNAPTWMTPLLDKFPVPTRSTSPFSSSSSHSSHSRSSSRSSNSSFSSGSSASSSTTVSSGCKSDGPGSKQSRRERARQARVFVDTSKIEVTPYDGGKTTVLTGGVMLGGGSPKAKRPATQGAWRVSLRV